MKVSLVKILFNLFAALFGAFLLHGLLVNALPAGYRSVYAEATELPILMAFSVFSGLLTGSILKRQAANLNMAIAVLVSSAVIIYLWLLGSYYPEHGLWLYFLGAGASSSLGVAIAHRLRHLSRLCGIDLLASILVLSLGLTGWALLEDTRRVSNQNLTKALNQKQGFLDFLSVASAAGLHRYASTENVESLFGVPCIVTLDLAQSRSRWLSLSQSQKAEVRETLDLCWGYLYGSSSSDCNLETVVDQMSCLRNKTARRIKSGEKWPLHIKQ